ncbi:MAG: CDP-alcohol phosphatidyltransferase family protein [Planctomycetota bacterium]
MRDPDDTPAPDPDAPARNGGGRSDRRLGGAAEGELDVQRQSHRAGGARSTAAAADRRDGRGGRFVGRLARVTNHRKRQRHSNRDLHAVRTRRFRRRVRPIAVLPTLCTLGNLIAGFAAIHFASRPGTAADEGILAGASSLTVAGMLIFIGMFFDGIDGFVARLTRSTSELGAQLDSLADLVTFGVAPAYMSLQMLAKSYYASDAVTIISPAHDDIFAKFFWAIAAFYVCCTALRLARFNVEVPPSEPVEKHLMFRGLPSPGAAGCIASLILLHQERLVMMTEPWVARATGFGMAFILPLCAFAMVSGLGYVHVVNRYIRGTVPFHAAVRLAVIVVLGLLFLNEALAIGFTAYALSAPVRTLYRRWRLRGRSAQGQ